MARFSSTKELSPAATSISADPTNSNSAKTEAAKDARVFVFVTVSPGGANRLNIDVETSLDDSRFADAGAFDEISVVGTYVFDVPQEKLSKFLRLQFHPSGGGTWELEAVIEKKQGV